MTARQRTAERHKQFAAAMIDLAADPRFAHYIEAIRDYREAAIDSLSSDPAIVKSERATLACIGEIAAYKSMIAIYDDFMVQAQERANAEADERTK